MSLIEIPKGASFDDMVSLKNQPDIGDRINKEILRPLFAANGLEGSMELVDFMANHAQKDLNLAVAYHMVNALDFFKDFDNEKVKEIAFEIALTGQIGIDPKKNGYRVSEIVNKNFSGYNLLAYYYVIWAIAISELVNDLQMPFEKEFELAKSIFEGGK
jgi:hypothetical protein